MNKKSNIQRFKALVAIRFDYSGEKARKIFFKRQGLKTFQNMFWKHFLNASMFNFAGLVFITVWKSIQYSANSLSFKTFKIAWKFLRDSLNNRLILKHKQPFAGE